MPEVVARIFTFPAPRGNVNAMAVIRTRPPLTPLTLSDSVAMHWRFRGELRVNNSASPLRRTHVGFGTKRRPIRGAHTREISAGAPRQSALLPWLYTQSAWAGYVPQNVR